MKALPPLGVLWIVFCPPSLAEGEGVVSQLVILYCRWVRDKEEPPDLLHLLPEREVRGSCLFASTIRLFSPWSSSKGRCWSVCPISLLFQVLKRWSEPWSESSCRLRWKLSRASGSRYLDRRSHCLERPNSYNRRALRLWLVLLNLWRGGCEIAWFFWFDGKQQGNTSIIATVSRCQGCWSRRCLCRCQAVKNLLHGLL